MNVSLELIDEVQAIVNTAIATAMSEQRKGGWGPSISHIADMVTSALLGDQSPISDLVHERDYEQRRADAYASDMDDAARRIQDLEEQKRALISGYVDRNDAWKTLEAAHVALSMIADHEPSCTDIHAHAQIRILASTISNLLSECRYVDEPFDAEWYDTLGLG